jgi:hypothetical protein
MLSQTSKMPCKSFNLPAQACKVGSELAKVKGSTCHGCYALKGFYRMPVVKKAMDRRLEAIKGDLWVDNMVYELEKEKSGFFRWHDSGDLQSLDHLKKIIAVCNATPHIKHWLPTRERKIVRSYKGIIPDNLTIRVSSTMVDTIQPMKGMLTSTVHSNKAAFGVACTAEETNNKCGDCRMCWDKTIPNISYKKH